MRETYDYCQACMAGVTQGRPDHAHMILAEKSSPITVNGEGNAMFFFKIISRVMLSNPRRNLYSGLSMSFSYQGGVTLLGCHVRGYNQGVATLFSAYSSCRAIL